MKTLKFILFIFIISMGCKKPYNPAVINSPKSYLVVEGVINVNDTTTIKVSRTVNLTSSVTTNPVNAAVTVESDNGGVFPLSATVTAGTYQLIGVTLDPTQKYRLRIKPSDNSGEYLSDFSAVKPAPSIDSVGFSLTSKGIQIYANAHDASKNTRYYRFSYVETWKFHSKYASNWLSDGTAIIQRPPDQQIYFCYANSASSTIILGSTAKLTEDVLYQAPITEVVSTSEKLEMRYSILIREYALSADEYKFWSTLKKNTEELGSIFDAEPSQINGNIHNINDPKDIVVGYIGAGTVATKRVFIDNTQLPQSFSVTYPYLCGIDSSFYNDPHSHQNTVQANLISQLEVPVNAIYSPPAPDPIGFTGAESYCVDCTLRGATKRPDFWTDK